MNPKLLNILQSCQTGQISCLRAGQLIEDMYLNPVYLRSKTGLETARAIDEKPDYYTVIVYGYSKPERWAKIGCDVIEPSDYLKKQLILWWDGIRSVIEK